MSQLDGDGNGTVDFDEFLTGMARWFLPPDSRASDDFDDLGNL